jgi:hypothetical protein
MKRKKMTGGEQLGLEQLGLGVGDTRLPQLNNTI